MAITLHYHQHSRITVIYLLQIMSHLHHILSPKSIYRKTSVNSLVNKYSTQKC